MSNRSRIVLGSLGGAFAIHLAALSCSGNHSTASDRDATVADAMQDAMAHLIDGEMRDAHAGGTAIEVACDQENTTTNTLLTDGGAYSYASENTYFFGIVPGVTVDPRTAPRVSAYVCDPESFGPANPCQSGYRCETRGATPPAAACVAVSPSVTADGRLVVYCGNRLNITSSTLTSLSGTHYRRAYVRIE